MPELPGHCRLDHPAGITFNLHPVLKPYRQLTLDVQVFDSRKRQGAVAVSGNLLRIPPCRNHHSVIVRPATTITHLPFKVGDFKKYYNILK